MGDGAGAHGRGPVTPGREEATMSRTAHEGARHVRRRGVSRTCGRSAGARARGAVGAALLLVLAACAQGGGAGSPGSSPPATATTPAQVIPATATVTPADLPLDVGTRTGLDLAAPVPSAVVDAGFTVVSGKVATTGDCGSPELTGVHVVGLDGTTSMDTEIELTALLGAGSADGVLVLGVRDYGEPGSSFSARRDGYLRIDAATGEVLGLIETTSRAEGQYGSAGEPGGIWIGTGPAELGLLDPRSGEILRTIPTPAPMTRVMATDRVLWVVNDLISPLQPYWQLDPSDGSVLASFEWSEETEANHPAADNPKPFSVAVDESLVLVDNDLVVTRVGPGGAMTAVKLTGLTGLPQRPTGAEGDAWVVVGEDQVVGIDVATLQVDGAYRVPGIEPMAALATSDGTLAMMRTVPGSDPGLVLIAPDALVG